VQIKMAIENIGNVAVDSFGFKYTTTDASNVERAQTLRVKPLQKDENTVVDFSIDSRNLAQAQKLTFDVNPTSTPIEITRANNVTQSSFFVQTDRRNPLLDVTFDGSRILNGDIVSPRPQVFVTLKDENKYLALADTSLFRLFLKDPSGLETPLYFSNGLVRFIPANAASLDKDNTAKIDYRPIFTQDGVYELSVRAKDASGNTSGALDYKVAFKVITKSSISNVLNYPNPFSTATRFVYTLTGETVPTVFKIQIMTVAGKIVREITQNEIGQLKIGTHLSDYVWDGTDEYGDKLANGVYLYRIISKKADGKTYESYDNGTNKFFENGFGKLVIVR
jgi:hypothetical protein